MPRRHARRREWRRSRYATGCRARRGSPPSIADRTGRASGARRCARRLEDRCEAVGSPISSVAKERPAVVPAGVAKSHRTGPGARHGPRRRFSDHDTRPGSLRASPIVSSLTCWPPVGGRTKIRLNPGRNSCCFTDVLTALEAQDVTFPPMSVRQAACGLYVPLDHKDPFDELLPGANRASGRGATARIRCSGRRRGATCALFSHGADGLAGKTLVGETGTARSGPVPAPEDERVKGVASTPAEDGTQWRSRHRSTSRCVWAQRLMRPCTQKPERPCAHGPMRFLAC